MAQLRTCDICQNVIKVDAPTCGLMIGSVDPIEGFGMQETDNIFSRTAHKREFDTCLTCFQKVADAIINASRTNLKSLERLQKELTW